MKRGFLRPESDGTKLSYHLQIFLTRAGVFQRFFIMTKGAHTLRTSGILTIVILGKPHRTYKFIGF